MTTRPRFTLTIEHDAKGDTAMALRHVLKRLLRTFGFRCITITPATDTATKPTISTEAAKP